ncbi:MAG: PEGA domain-containing protein [Myxococcota bacterium]
MFRALLASTLVVIMTLTMAPSASASGKLSDAAYEAGKTALDAGNLEGALVHFKSALALAEGDEGRAWQLLIAISLTYKDMGQPGYTLEYHQRFLAETKDHLEVMAPKWKKRRAWVEQDIEALQTEAGKTHGYLSVTSTPRGAAVLIDGEPAGADGDATTPYALYIKPGDYQVSVRHHGATSEARTLQARAGKTHPLSFKLKTKSAPVAPQAAAATTAPSATAVAAAPRYKPRPRTMRIALGWSTAGVGIASVAGGAILLGLAHADQAAADAASNQIEAQGLIDDANTKMTPGWVLIGVGSAAVVAGVLWAYLNVQKENAEQAWIAPSTNGLVLGGRF